MLNVGAAVAATAGWRAGVDALVAVELDDAMLGAAGELVAREQAAVRRSCPRLPVSFERPEACTEALQELLARGGVGAVAVDHGRPVAVMTATVGDSPVVGPYARLPAEGLAVDTGIVDPTSVLAVVYAALASTLVSRGIVRHYVLHVAEARLAEALANLGFARHGVYAVQAVAARMTRPTITVRHGGLADLDTIARLAMVELAYRSAAPMFGPQVDRQLEDLRAEHRTLHDAGAVHLLAIIDGREVGLLTIEPHSPVPRLCPAGQPYIGPTATLPHARGRGVGQALVEAALTHAHGVGHEWISVDLEAANRLSRPFWLGAGFTPTGYGMLRLIDPQHNHIRTG